MHNQKQIIHQPVVHIKIFHILMSQFVLLGVRSEGEIVQQKEAPNLFPLELVYACSGFQHLDTKFIVTFSNDLGTLTGRNSIGYCSSETYEASLSVTDTDRENLYKVIGDRQKGSLLSSVKSIDVEITGSAPSLIRTSRGNPRSTFNYVDPKNFHEELSGSDLSGNPVKLRLYEK